MSAAPPSETSRPPTPRHPLVTVLSLLFILLGLVLGGLGMWLFQLGGSPYYVLAGSGLLVSGVLLWTNRAIGAWLFFAVFIATVFWTAWESGSDYWRWLPRIGAFAVLAFVLALLLPTLRDSVPPRASRTAAGVLGLGLVLLVGLAFASHGEITGDQAFPEAAPSAGLAPTREVSAQPADDPAAADWTAWGRSNAGTRYSPLQQITPENVAQLAPAWEFRTGDRPRRRWGAETTPLKVGDTLYLCSARNQLIALNAATGALRWRFDPKVRDTAIPSTTACRGVAYYEVPAAPQVDPLLSDVAADLAVPVTLPAEDGGVVSTSSRAPCAARIIEGTLDGRLVAVDAASGRPCAQFGNNGQVDITLGMGEVVPGQVAIIAPPTIARGLIITGHQGLQRADGSAPSGVIQAFDAQSGKLRWAWDLGDPERTNRPPQGNTYTPGTPRLLTTATSDEQLGLVYLPLGDAVAAEGNVRMATSLVALDASTGKPAWTLQAAPGDAWNDDLVAQASLVDFPTAAGKVPALVLPTRQGDLYMLDRRTGQRLDPPAAAVPASVSGALKRTHTLDERDMWGLTPLDQLVCRIQFRRAAQAGAHTRIAYPGQHGGVDWGGVAVDPRHGVIVSNYTDLPDYLRKGAQADSGLAGWLSGAPFSGAGAQGTAGDSWRSNAGWRLLLTGLSCKQPPYGGLRAVELRSGALLWDRPFGSARGLGPFGLRSHLPIEIGAPNAGGAVVTAGGLIFIAAANDDLLRAIDLKTGKELWRTTLPAGGQATPMVYQQGGRQYVVIVAAGHHAMGTPRGDYVMAYALPE
ncbi:PQQ-binding-like beta-propeller repeat protein [Stenotrophomonas sp. 278]|uniref:outer membrane protein assembly factor BamB family protein n=1 Tax=Stenotrophomonas sp. 278 TaxID=2479851 RepID=UPI000F67C5C7|nr:PQQ-binding-like beta-propeller repeat protein [Stenotrophomonas sp. 278]RRU16808.1 membrane-bound PQQ-dependent dehydrogenase, glucose/quinate/shikimate family [Stenotrophomonas sp. 278]